MSCRFGSRQEKNTSKSNLQLRHKTQGIPNEVSRVPCPGLTIPNVFSFPFKRIFDSFYAVTLTVSPDKFDIVYGYFTSVCDTKNIAANFTAFLSRIAQETQIDVLELLSQIQGTNNKLQMNKVLIYYLNSLKSKASLYGITGNRIPNLPVARNIIR
jgi:hypothetical protein